MAGEGARVSELGSSAFWLVCRVALPAPVHSRAACRLPPAACLCVPQCPMDFKYAGEIVDDELNRMLINPLPKVGGKTLLLFPTTTTAAPL